MCDQTFWFVAVTAVLFSVFGMLFSVFGRSKPHTRKSDHTPESHNTTEISMNDFELVLGFESAEIIPSGSLFRSSMRCLPMSRQRRM